jgi:sterol desaturase/sphingolipid hydroxylase (fatty acid hydroxylase superfamily)
MQDYLQDLLHQVYELHDLLTSNQSRIYWIYLLCAALIALWAYRRDHATEQRSARGFLAWLLPARMYLHRSFGVDVGLIVFSHLFGPARWLFEGFTILSVATAVQLGLSNWIDPVELQGGLATKCAVGLVIFLAKDFAMFFIHYLHHKIPLLWELHRVHHSAEHLNPLTAFRLHPIEEMLEGVSVVLIAGTAMGLLGIWFDLSFLHKGYLFVHIWVFLRLFNMLGANLRHMHIWITFPGWIGKVFSSPAMHQIHHSIDPVHYGKNMGYFLNVWDWAFGTLYLPTRREHLAFGVVDGVTHTGPLHALAQPLKGMLGVLLRGRQDSRATASGSAPQ